MNMERFQERSRLIKRFKALRAEFDVLKKQWQAEKNLDKRVVLSDRIMNVLNEAQALLESLDKFRRTLK